MRDKYICKLGKYSQSMGENYHSICHEISLDGKICHLPPNRKVNLHVPNKNKSRYLQTADKLNQIQGT